MVHISYTRREFVSRARICFMPGRDTGNLDNNEGEEQCFVKSYNFDEAALRVLRVVFVLAGPEVPRVPRASSYLGR